MSSSNNTKTSTQTVVDNDQLMRHKAMKYHYKNQKKLKEMMAKGMACPAGYEKYLRPFEG